MEQEIWDYIESHQDDNNNHVIAHLHVTYNISKEDAKSLIFRWAASRELFNKKIKEINLESKSK